MERLIELAVVTVGGALLAVPAYLAAVFVFSLERVS